MNTLTDKTDATATIEAIAARLRDEYGAEAVILYGSRAKGCARPDSDIDLMVIKPFQGNKIQGMTEVSDILRDLTKGYALDAQVVSPKGVEKTLAHGNHFMQDVILEGKALYDGGIYATLLRLAKESYKMNPQDSHFPEYWTKMAERDYNRVTLLLDNDDPEGAAFHLQQATEKLFKAYLIRQGWRLQRTHDLTTLLNEAVKYDPSMEEYRAICKLVNRYYIATRYPPSEDMEEPPPMEDADIHASLADITPLIERLRAGSARTDFEKQDKQDG